MPSQTVFVDTGERIPVPGDRVTTLCGLAVVYGPHPTEVLPDIPSNYFAECADCQAVIWDEPSVIVEGAERVARVFLRKPGSLPVHIIEIGAETALPIPLVALCGEQFSPSTPVDRVSLGHGAPCTACLLRS